MSRIEKLEMQGFKSFPSKTVITFPANFAVVAGPNGSGKSNVLDSIIFVLGRTSAKSLRADKMLELIFHGSKMKPQSDFAKVTMLFDNSDKTFPIEDDKVTVSRKVNRSGVSMYKLNGKTVTRETVQEVLRKANVNPDGHNIILQGDITEIIEMSPLGRREIIDEISGIMEFNEKKIKSERELMTVEERLKESLIILTERDSSIKRLKDDWEIAQKYKKMTNELDKLRASLAKTRLDETENSMQKIDEKVSKKEEEIKKFIAEVASVDKELESVEKRKSDIAKKFFDRAKDVKLIKEVEQLRSEISRKQDKIEFNKAEILRTDELVRKIEEFRQHELEGSAGRAVQAVLKQGWTGVYGTVASLSKIPNEYKTAIEVAAGNHMHDVIVSNQDTAVQCVNYLKSNRIGRATFLPLDKIQERELREKKILEEKGVVGLAIGLLKFDQKYWHAFSSVFGDTVVVDRIETVKRIGIGRARFVTLDGDLVERSGAVIGGFYHSAKSGPSSNEAEKYEKQKKYLSAEIKSLEDEISELSKKLHKLSSEEQVGSKFLVESRDEIEKIEKEIEILRLKRKEFYEQKLILEDEVNRLRINKAKWEAALENIRAEFENYRSSKEFYDLAASTLENKIREALHNINSLGAINMKALEEYEHQKTEYEELRGKVDILTVERDKILQVIADVEVKQKEVFSKTFEQLRDEFKIVFKDLTGGEADLRLEGESLEESGLIIEASPAGKRLLNIDAMSGGEKTLTAITFLFAIQRIKPAPFYILDEVDAALDKPNTKKIVELLKQYSKRSQFIVISHNDMTVSAADCVYGVSMEEGESKLVGIRMPEVS